MSLIETKRFYYENPHATARRTAWQRRGPNVIALAESVAFPEGGGQLPDVGVIRQGDTHVRFVDTQKRFCRRVFPKDFPPVDVGGEIQLTLEVPVPAGLDEGAPIEVAIDVLRRANLARSHTAGHLVYIGILAAVPDAKKAVCGCLIDMDGGRFDLRLGGGRLTPEQIAAVAGMAADWNDANHAITIEAPVPNEPDCRVWVSSGSRIPCGGCHLPRTGLVGKLQIQRRSKGKDVERVYYTLLSPLSDEYLNHYVVGAVGEEVKA